MKKKVISSIVITSLMLLNSCSLFQKGPYEPFKSGHGFSLIEEGYSVPVTAQSDALCWACSGATAMQYNLMLTRGIDDEIDIDYLSLLAFSGDAESGTEGNYSNNLQLAGGHQIMVIEAASSHDINGCILVEAEDLSSADTGVLQDRIRNNGALTALIVPDSDQFESIQENATYNVPDAEFRLTHHMVTVVGWDDDYPADTFDPPAASNGAWLIQDSQGTDFGDEGFYWISYDTPLYGVCDYILSNEYTEVLSYEAGVQAVAVTEGGTAVANVFDHEGTIGAIGTYTTGSDQTLTVEIYDGEFGDLICTKEQTFEYIGYHTIELDEPIDVGRYTVVVRFPEGAPVEGSSIETDLSPLGGDYVGTVRGFYASIEEGQSYIYLDGEWVDMSTDGIADQMDFSCETRETLMGLTYRDRATITEAPNNACIKVLYIA